MKVRGAIALLCGAFLFASCERAPHDPMLYLRISELEDSLKAYRDSLEDAQLAFSFNAVTVAVIMKDREVKLGDSCHAEILIGAANTPEAVAKGYAYGDATLEMSSLPYSRITRTDTRWLVSFLPQHLGEDSLVGTINMTGRGGPEPKMNFSAEYKVVPR